MKLSSFFVIESTWLRDWTWFASKARIIVHYICFQIKPILYNYVSILLIIINNCNKYVKSKVIDVR